MLPGIPGRFRFFLLVSFGGAAWFSEEETLASPEPPESILAEELSAASVGISIEQFCCPLRRLKGENHTHIVEET